MAGWLRLLLLLITISSLGFQLRTVVRVGVSGLAPAAWLGMLTSTLFWLGYGVSTAELTLVTINVTVLLVQAVLIAIFLRHGVTRRGTVASYAVVPLGVWVVSAEYAAPWVLAAGGTLMMIGRMLPQLSAVLRTADASGVSQAAWVGNGVANGAWGAYGFQTADAFVAWPSVLAAVVSFAIVAVCAVRRERTDRAHRSL